MIDCWMSRCWMSVSPIIECTELEHHDYYQLHDDQQHQHYHQYEHIISIMGSRSAATWRRQLLNAMTHPLAHCIALHCMLHWIAYCIWQWTELCTLHCILHIAHCTVLNIAHCILHMCATLHHLLALNIAHGTLLHIAHCILHMCTTLHQLLNAMTPPIALNVARCTAY